MRDLDLDLAAGGGIHRSSTLIQLGHSRRGLAVAIAEHRAVRVRIGWIAHAGADPAGIRAVELGGRLTGSTALRSLGIWSDQTTGVSVACSPQAARLQPLRPGERRTWRQDRFPDAGRVEGRVSALDALREFGVDASPAGSPNETDDGDEGGDIGDQIQRIIASYNRNRTDE